MRELYWGLEDVSAFLFEQTSHVDRKMAPETSWSGGAEILAERCRDGEFSSYMDGLSLLHSEYATLKGLDSGSAWIACDL